MKGRLTDIFSLHFEKEKYETVIENIDNGVSFRGTNLWILIFAIAVASLGLNVNSTAVIIGAMLISPLMGPIMGIGLSLGINDTVLLRKSIFNFGVATIVALCTSTVFFLVSPLSDAHSEILARTSPTIYDVLIALAGGFAGIIATSSRQKGNVIPGVAIATALMPPLCTAGYGLATFQFSYFFGSFYLFVINTVFIALATLLIVRLLRFPHKHLRDTKTEILASRITWLVVIVTLVPSIYFGYDMVRQDRFDKKVNRFITEEAHFTNDYLLNKKINAKTKSILLVFGGKEIQPKEIEQLKGRLKYYGLQNATLEIKQGFAYLADKISNPDNNDRLNGVLAEKVKEAALMQGVLDSIATERKNAYQLYRELKVQYPAIRSAVLEPSTVHVNDSIETRTFLVILDLPGDLPKKEMQKLDTWLHVRLKEKNITLIRKP